MAKNRAATTSVILGIAAWAAVLGQCALIFRIGQADEPAEGIGSFLPVLLLSFCTLALVTANIVFGVIARKRATEGPKPLAGLVIGTPLVLLFLVAILAGQLLK